MENRFERELKHALHESSQRYEIDPIRVTEEAIGRIRRKRTQNAAAFIWAFIATLTLIWVILALAK